MENITYKDRYSHWFDSLSNGFEPTKSYHLSTWECKENAAAKFYFPKPCFYHHRWQGTHLLLSRVPSSFLRRPIQEMANPSKMRCHKSGIFLAGSHRESQAEQSTRSPLSQTDALRSRKGRERELQRVFWQNISEECGNHTQLSPSQQQRPDGQTPSYSFGVLYLPSKVLWNSCTSHVI